MGQSVTLKGTKDGYQLVIQSSELTKQIIEDTKALLEKIESDTNEEVVTDSTSKEAQGELAVDQDEVHKEKLAVESGEVVKVDVEADTETTEKEAVKKATIAEKIALNILTENFLLSEEEKVALKDVIEAYDLFEVKTIESNTVEITSVKDWITSHALQVHTGNIRSGQIINASTDLLFIGNVQPGGEIRANRNIFVIGDLKGIAHAGAEGDTQAVIAADFKHESQIRIADRVQIIEPTADLAGNFKAALINDQASFEFQDIKALDTLRPDITKLMGGELD